MPDLSEKELDAQVEEATVDAYGDDEQVGCFAVMIEENLKMPFETTVLGVQVTVTGITQYSFGDFRGDPGRLLEEYFDACLYAANWDAGAGVPAAPGSAGRADGAAVLR